VTIFVRMVSSLRRSFSRTSIRQINMMSRIGFETNVKFPSCMVDRITPRTTEELRQEVESVFPGYGQTAVQTEEYTQWVIEDKFASDFPDLTQVGVIITDDIEPYEETKIRILNGGHTSLAYLGALSGYNTFDEVMNDPRYIVNISNISKRKKLHLP
jgi:D-arabinitol 4-dehydrogenase